MNPNKEFANRQASPRKNKQDSLLKNSKAKKAITIDVQTERFKAIVVPSTPFRALP